MWETLALSSQYLTLFTLPQIYVNKQILGRKTCCLFAHSWGKKKQEV